MAAKHRISVQRGVGHTGITIECNPVYAEDAVRQAKELLEAMPESTFAGDGISITTIPSHGLGMDGPVRGDG